LLGGSCNCHQHCCSIWRGGQRPSWPSGPKLRCPLVHFFGPLIHDEYEHRTVRESCRRLSDFEIPTRLRHMHDRSATRYVETLDGVSLAYKITGDGPIDLVWIAGLGYPGDLVADEPGFVHLAGRLGRFTRTIWYETRGFGASGGTFTENTPELLVADLTALLDAENLEHVVLLGWGHSGTVAIRYAVAHPERTKALVLVDSYARYVQGVGYSVGPTEDELEERLALARQVWGTGFLLMALAPSRVDDGLLRERIGRYERLGFSPDNVVDSTRLACTQDVRELLPRISCPTLVLHREGGRFITSDAGRYLGNRIPGVRYVELPGEDQLFFVGDIDGLIDPIEEFLTGGRQNPEGDLVTATIMFTDIASSTERSARLGHRKWTALTDDHDAIVRSVLQRTRGREIKTLGDGFLAVFDSTTRGVRAATEIVNSTKGIGLDVRAGVHVGEIEVRPDDVIGLAVNIAKRICDLAKDGEVLVSENVRGTLVGSEIRTVDRGNYSLKGVPDVWRLFAIEVPS
jgi:class 3 adenylate cyclase/pimeloyl-ACP methyl ester carboxylesterase